MSAIRQVACLAAALLAFVHIGVRSGDAAGAFAVGDCGAYGHAIDFPTQAAARQAALAQCGGQCRVVADMRKSCAAFAIDARNVCGAHGYAADARLGRAQNTALRYCYQYGGRECVIRAWACDGSGG